MVGVVAGGRFFAFAFFFITSSALRPAGEPSRMPAGVCLPGSPLIGLPSGNKYANPGESEIGEKALAKAIELELVARSLFHCDADNRRPKQFQMHTSGLGATLAKNRAQPTKSRAAQPTKSPQALASAGFLSPPVSRPTLIAVDIGVGRAARAIGRIALCQRPRGEAFGRLVDSGL